MSANEPMSDERLARLAADNEPVGDHLSGLTADEVAELVDEVKRARAASVADANAYEAGLLQIHADRDHWQQRSVEEWERAETAKRQLAEVQESLELSEAQLVEVTLERAEWRKQAQQHETVAKILRAQLHGKFDIEYTVGNGIEPYRPATFTNAEAARHSRDLHHDKDGQIMLRLVGEWEVLPDDE